MNLLFWENFTPKIFVNETIDENEIFKDQKKPNVIN